MFDETDNHLHRWEGDRGRLSYVAVTGSFFKIQGLNWTETLLDGPQLSSGEDVEDTFMNNSMDTGITLHL